MSAPCASHGVGCTQRALLSVRRAFTLIELLVVIAIIALLISILLPALSQARESGLATVCTANMSQLSKAVNLYAVDSKDVVWPKFDWAPIQYQVGAAAPVMGQALLYKYVEDVFKINECPKNKRRNIQGTVNTAIDPQFGRQLGVGFDYTMIGRFEGLKLGNQPQVAFIKSPSAYAAQSKPPVLRPGDQLTRMTGTPIYAEESTNYNNSGITDGLWGNWDQITRRHFKKGNMAFLEGHAGAVKVPTTGPEGPQVLSGDFDCNDLYVSGTSSWVRLEPNNTDDRFNRSERPFGWANNPKP